MKYWRGRRVTIHTELSTGLTYITWENSHGWVAKEEITDGFDVYLAELEK